MSIEAYVVNALQLDKNSVWILEKGEKFDYSDGVESEVYLKKTLENASDLSSDSYELEKSIKDWNSEYHLSRKRTQYLKAFAYNRDSNVLEVGSGCGAITRFLGETFKSVIGIEGSITRASIARERTRDLKNVSLICAPFQEIKFKQKFDIIFCIGVFEYSGMFVDAEDPYQHILEYFSSILAPDGQVVIAIENKFGIKYFNAAPEDHTGIPFDGIEGYKKMGNRNAKTFGYNELEFMLKQSFSRIDFYYPFPDYKLPSCILSDKAFKKVKAAELVATFKDNSLQTKHQRAIFSEKFALIEIEKSKMLYFFSNSFLVVAGKSMQSNISFPQLGKAFSTNRVKEFQTETTLVDKEGDKVFVEKRIVGNKPSANIGKLTLHPCTSEWLETHSLQTELLCRVKDKSLSLKEIFSSAKPWVDEIKRLSATVNGEMRIPGKHLDSIWTNCFVVKDECIFIDQEWEWENDFPLKRLVIKSISEFLSELTEIPDINPVLKSDSRRKLIKRIAESLDFSISDKDIATFVRIEVQISSLVYGKSTIGSSLINWIELRSRKLAKTLYWGNKTSQRLKQKVARVFLAR